MFDLLLKLDEGTPVNMMHITSVKFKAAKPEVDEDGETWTRPPELMVWVNEMTARKYEGYECVEAACTEGELFKVYGERAEDLWRLLSNQAYRNEREMLLDAEAK